MTAANETAYRDLKASYTNKEIELYFQPSQNEIDFALKAARKPMARLAILVHIKTLHRIGRFRMLGEIPIPVARYMMRFLPKCNYDRYKYLKLDNPASRNRILKVTRKYTGTLSYDSSANIISKRVAADASRTKDKIPDIINV